MKIQPNTDFSQFRDYLIKILPQLLREEPELATTIEGIMAQQFPRRDDFARLLEEVKSLRQEMNVRFELQSQEFQEHRKDTEQHLNLLRQEWREEREQNWKQLRQEWREDLKQQMELLRQEWHQDLKQQMELLRQEWREDLKQQMELLRQEWREDLKQHMDMLRQEWRKDLEDFGQQLRQEWRKDLEDFGQQLRQEWHKDLVDFGQQLRQEWHKDLVDFGQQLRQEWRKDLGELRQEMEGRFEQVDKRFEQVDQRFEQVDKRFEQVDQRFEQVDKRFEQVDGQLTGLRQDVTQLKRNVINLQAGQEGIIRRLDGQEAWLRMTIGHLHNEKGESLEDMFAVGLRYGLKDEDITPETIQLRQPLMDLDGLVFKKGYVTEVDVVAQNGKLIVFEVKATAKLSEVDFFAWKVQLVTAQNPTLQVRGVFICLGAKPEVKERCLENGLELLN